MSSYNILLADIEVNNLKALARTLRYDYNIFPATNSESIPGIMEQKEIAVILSNYKMPGMNSVENIEKILQPYSDTVSIILGPYTEAERMVNAVSESQIYSYITMPWEPEEIKAVVREGIEAYELNRAMKKPYTRVLLDGGVITREQLEEAIKRQNQEEIPIETILREKCRISEGQIEKAREISRYRSRSMADALLEIGAITKSDIEEAQKLQKSRRKKLVEILVELGYADEESIYSCYAIQLGIPYLSLDQVPDKPEILSVLSSDLAYKHSIVPVDLIGKTIVVAAIEPLSDETKREIELETGYKPMVICSSYKDIHIALDRYCSIEEIPQQKEEDKPSQVIELGFDCIVNIKSNEDPVNGIARNLDGEYTEITILTPSSRIKVKKDVLLSIFLPAEISPIKINGNIVWFSDKDDAVYKDQNGYLARININNMSKIDRRRLDLAAQQKKAFSGSGYDFMFSN